MQKTGIKGSLRLLFKENHDKKLTINEIYNLFPKYYKIPNSMKKRSTSDTADRPIYKNYVRSALYRLVDEGMIEKKSRGCYYFTKEKQL